jgi:hypothetical protein
MQKYETLCFVCLNKKLEAERVTDPTNDEQKQKWGGIILQDSTNIILSTWYSRAQMNLSRRQMASRTSKTIEISDDEYEENDFHFQHSSCDDDQIKESSILNDSSSKIVKVWLHTVRTRLQQDTLEE